MISTDSVVVASREQISSDLAGEAVILDLKNGMYYGLNAIGAFMWQLIQEPRSVEQLRNAVMDVYDVERDQCERDITAWLQELEAVGLVQTDTRADGLGIRA